MSEKLAAKERLIEAGKMMFAEKGFAGATMRGICKQAGTGPNMIHHYFGNMEGLYQAIVRQFSSDIFDSPLRLIIDTPRTEDEMVIKFQLFTVEILEALIKDRLLFQIMKVEKGGFKAFQAYRNGVFEFFEGCKKAGLMRASINSNMLPGFLLDRLGNQILHAAHMESDDENVITNPEYRKLWVKENTDILLYGLVQR